MMLFPRRSRNSREVDMSDEQTVRIIIGVMANIGLIFFIRSALFQNAYHRWANGWRKALYSIGYGLGSLWSFRKKRSRSLTTTG